jgi:hypothetical protein
MAIILVGCIAGKAVMVGNVITVITFYRLGLKSPFTAKFSARSRQWALMHKLAINLA